MEDMISVKAYSRKSKADAKFEKVLHEFKHGQLYTGKDKSIKVRNRSQALAIAYSEARAIDSRYGLRGV